MYELTINTDTFFLTSAFYYDKACEHPCPTIVPLVQGLAGTLRVHFVGELAPEASDSCLFAIRPYRGVDDLYRTEYAEGAVDEDGDVYFDIDLNVSTAELVGALTGREVLDVKAGFVVVNDDQSVRREFQSASTISKTVLAQNETAPLPKATAQSEADYYAGKYVSEWLWCGEFQSDITDAVSELIVPLGCNVQNLCSTVGQIDKNYEALSADVDAGFANAKTCREQLASEVYACIGSTVETIAGTYATKEELSSVETKADSNTSAIADETSRAKEAEKELQNSISENTSAISAEASRAKEAENALQASVSENATAIAGLQNQLVTDEEAISQNASNIEALKSSLADYATVEALSAETSRATAREDEIEAKIPDVSGFATSEELGAEVDRATGVEASLETAIETNASSIEALQTASGNYVTLNEGQEILGQKTFLCKTRFSANIYFGEISCANHVKVTDSDANLAGTWTYEGNKIATVADIPDTSDFVTTIDLDEEIADRKGADACLKCAIGENKSDIGNLQSSINDLQNASSNYVTLDGGQTISGYKTFSNYVNANGGIHFDNSCNDMALKNTSSNYMCLIGTWKYEGNEIATKDDIPDASNYVTVGSVQTITGTKYFTSCIVIGGNTEIEIKPMSGHACLKGEWRLNGEEIATVADIPDTSKFVTSCALNNYVTRADLTTSQFTIQGEWHFDGEVQMTNNGYSVDLQEGMLGGKWKMEGKQLATVDDIPGDVDTSNFVTLSDTQTIAGQKTFSGYTRFRCIVDICGPIYVGSAGSVAVTTDDDVVNLEGRWTYNGVAIATSEDIPSTSNFVNLTSTQTIVGEKTFSGATTFTNSTTFTNGLTSSGVTTLCSGLHFASCDVTIARNSGGNYGCLSGTWRLNGAAITTRDISDALDARITALEEKLGG